MITNETEIVGQETGLNNKPKKEWKGVTESEEQLEPIALLEPGSDRHNNVLKYLQKRIKHSERKMSQFYDRWTANEYRVHACVDEE